MFTCRSVEYPEVRFFRNLLETSIFHRNILSKLQFALYFSLIFFV